MLCVFLCVPHSACNVEADAHRDVSRIVLTREAHVYLPTKKKGFTTIWVLLIHSRLSDIPKVPILTPLAVSTSSWGFPCEPSSIYLVPRSTQHPPPPATLHLQSINKQVVSATGDCFSVAIQRSEAIFGGACDPLQRSCTAVTSGTCGRIMAPVTA